MEPDLVTALWIVLIVLLTMWLSRMAAGVMANSDNAVINKLGSALGGVVG